MNRILPAVLAALLAACSTATQPDPNDAATSGAAPDGETVDLLYVFDGDSIEVARSDGSRAEVRLLGVNAPEGDECHGDAARAHLVELLGTGAITLVADEDEVDQFGRLLRYVYADTTNVNLALVTAGAAFAVQSGHTLEPQFLAAATTASASGSGLWSSTACGADPPVPGITIGDFEFDAPGRDAANPNGEWVTFTNPTGEPMSMADWIVRDESTQHRYRFPSDFRLDPDEVVYVYSGCGDPSPRDLYWCASDPVWSNGGDTIVLQMPDGTVVTWQQYAGDF